MTTALRVIAFLAFIGLLYSAFTYGGMRKEAENLKAANDSLRQMEKDNVEIRKLDTDAYCAEFGYKWLPDKGECG